MNHRVTLNVPYDQPQESWESTMKVYQSMPGWIPGMDLPRWFGTEHEATFVWASVEPGGIVLEAQMEQESWNHWLEELCTRLSSALGRAVIDVDA